MSAAANAAWIGRGKNRRAVRRTIEQPMAQINGPDHLQQKKTHADAEASPEANNCNFNDDQPDSSTEQKGTDGSFAASSAAVKKSTHTSEKDERWRAKIANPTG
jgi:hypothetical protein